MKLNRVSKVYRPMRIFGTLLKDIFWMGKRKESKHGWIRYPLYVKNKYQQTKVLKVIKESIIKKQTILNESSKRQ
mgnify:FL=1|tara:strand:+ start:112 stop:336 length:225 start_codon:yes stop_codon:yes gene_type:complete